MEIRKMMDNKRSPCSVDDGGFAALKSKRPKSTKDKKDQIGERIVALQQLVSPYGKTDTASVLLETTEYIRFLHEQIKVLSAPYILKNKMQDGDPYSLRNRGLCLVPISCTVGVAGSNGADIWAPINTTSPKFDKAYLTQFN